MFIFCYVDIHCYYCFPVFLIRFLCMFHYVFVLPFNGEQKLFKKKHRAFYFCVMRSDSDIHISVDRVRWGHLKWEFRSGHWIWIVIVSTSATGREAGQQSNEKDWRDTSICYRQMRHDRATTLHSSVSCACLCRTQAWRSLWLTATRPCSTAVYASSSSHLRIVTY